MSINRKFIWSVAVLALGMPMFAAGQTAAPNDVKSPKATKSVIAANAPIEIQSRSKANRDRSKNDKNFKLRVARLEHLRDLALRHDDKARASKLDRIIQRLRENRATRRAAIRDRTRDHVEVVKDRVSDHRDIVLSARAERRADRIERAVVARARLSHREAQQRDAGARRRTAVKHAHAKLEHNATAGQVRRAVAHHRKAVDRRQDRRRDNRAHARHNARDKAHKAQRRHADRAAKRD